MELIILILMIYFFYKLYTNESLLIGLGILTVITGVISGIVSWKKEKSRNAAYEKTINNIQEEIKESQKTSLKGLKNHSARNNLLTDRYNDLINHEKALENRKKELEESIKDIQLQINDIDNFVGKPALMSKKKYMRIKADELESLRNKLSECQSELSENLKASSENMRIALGDKYMSSENEIKSFFKLINCKISYKNNLKYLNSTFKPVSIEYEGYEIYIFSNSIWIFTDENEFAGAYNPSAVQVSYSEKEAVTEKIPHYTWEHTRKDGSPDLRYKNNRMTTYYTTRVISEAEYKVTLYICNLSRTLTFKTLPDNIDNCIVAVRKYSHNKGVCDSIPALVELLGMCVNSKDKELTDKIKNNMRQRQNKIKL